MLNNWYLHTAHTYSHLWMRVQWARSACAWSADISYRKKKAEIIFELLTTDCCEFGECMISCFSSWSRFRNDAEHCEHGCDPSTDMLGLMELPRFSSISSSLILLDECVDVGVCCWCNGCCWCCCSRWCFMKKSAGTFSLSPVKPDTNDGTRDARENDKQIYKIIARFHLLQNLNQWIFIKKN